MKLGVRAALGPLHSWRSRSEGSSQDVPEIRTHSAVVSVRRQASDPPPMKWSALWYGFEPGGRIDVEEATQA